MPVAIIKSIQDVNKALNWADGTITKALEGGPVRITLDRPEPPKSDGQRGKFHAMISDIKKTASFVVPGKRLVVMDHFDLDQCKALLVMWFVNEMEGGDIKIPNPPRNFDCPITGQTITIRPSTTQWGKKLTSVFVEWLYATGSMAGAKWSEPAIKEYESYREAQK